MATIWVKILIPVDNANKTIEARNATIDVEVDNLNVLRDQLHTLRGNWKKIWAEVEAVAESMDIDFHHGFVGIRRTMGEINLETYKINVFYKAIDHISQSITNHFEAIYAINANFRFL